MEIHRNGQDKLKFHKTWPVHLEVEFKKGTISFVTSVHLKNQQTLKLLITKCIQCFNAGTFGKLHLPFFQFVYGEHEQNEFMEETPDTLVNIEFQMNN